MKNILLVLCLTIGANAKAQWKEMAHFDSTRVFFAGVKGSKILAIPKYIGNNTSYFLSTNKGLSFTTLNWIDTPWQMSGGAFFVDSNTVYMPSENGSYVKSVDGGLSWTRYFISGEINPLTGVHFFNNATAFFSTRKIIYKTNDTGISFVKTYIPISPLGRENALQSFSFTDEMNGIIACTNYSTSDSIWENSIYHTMNGGANWHLAYYSTMKQTKAWDYKDLRQVQMLDINIGYAMGEGGIFIKTTNGGFTWTDVNPSHNYSVTQFAFLKESFGFAIVQNSIILKTTNGGLTWVNDTFDYVNMFALPLNFTIANDSTLLLTALPGTFNGDSYIYQYITKATELGINNPALKSQFKIYPNPTNNIINLEYENSLKIQGIQLIDLSGKGIRTYSKSDRVLNVSGLPSGVYFLVIHTEQGSVYEKVIVP
ncbi:MAG: T9SS type A sorting domain-containing protein [Bacteroidetes bacterium]|nr:T9SS type A sorting domain-containing protein [Bacteroidota bacterium]